MKLNKTAEEWAAMYPWNIPARVAQEDIATLHAEIARLQEALDTCRELREYDRQKMERLQGPLTVDEVPEQFKEEPPWERIY